MLFKNLLGQPVAKRILQRAWDEGRLAQSYLFYGPAGVGKETAALDLAMAVNCQNTDDAPCGSCPQCRMTAAYRHPDLHYVFPVPHPSSESDKKKLAEEIAELLAQKAEDPSLNLTFDRPVSISIDDIRTLQSHLSLQPYQGRRKAVVMIQPEAMTVEAANAFLKTLEEPSPTTIFTLVSDRPNQLLATINSRCQKIRFERLTREQVANSLQQSYGQDAEQATLLAGMAGGSLGRALELLDEDLMEERKQATAILNASLQKKYSQMMEHIDLAAEEKGRPERILNLMGALVLEKLHSTNRDADPGKLQQLSGSIEQAREALARNVTPRLCLMAACNPDYFKEDL
jgi:DNA polymerase-3 subunit delta'